MVFYYSFFVAFCGGVWYRGIMSYARQRIEQYECGMLWKVIKLLFWFSVIVWGPIVLFMLGVLLGWFVFV